MSGSSWYREIPEESIDVLFSGTSNEDDNVTLRYNCEINSCNISCMDEVSLKADASCFNRPNRPPNLFKDCKQMAGLSSTSNHLSASSAHRPSPRMRRLASHLASIKISLDPPSPPFLSPLTVKEFDSNTMNYLQVPGVEPDDGPRLSSPPPDRRSSFASTTSDASSMTIPMSSSYQNLLSPMWTCVKYYSDDNETPPNEPIHRPRSAQSNPSGECICVPPVLLSPVLSRPVRSQSANSSPLPIRHHGSDSESDVCGPWRGSGGIARRSLASSHASGGGKDYSRPNTPTLSPILNRSSSGSRLAAAFQSVWLLGALFFNEQILYVKLIDDERSTEDERQHMDK
uniref:ZP domain-containing protein n=1 Tax=Heterorhabditis bacteriophora TaxID=37862 RepID=A0A1I7XF02_HETBA